MRWVTLAAASLLFAATSGIARAADIPVKPARSAVLAVPTPWSGFYVGGNIGYGWINDDSGALDTFSPSFRNAVTNNSVTLNHRLRPEGVVGGGQIGYNWSATPNWIVGVEADFQGSDLRGFSTVNQPGTPGVATPALNTASQKLSWFGTVRGRVGYAGLPSTNTLLYVTGGLAFGRVETSAGLTAVPSTSGIFFGADRETRTGFAVGAGAEHAFSEKWRAKLEYLYMDLRSTSVRSLDPVQFPGSFLDYGFDNRYHILRAGVNYAL